MLSYIYSLTLLFHLLTSDDGLNPSPLSHPHKPLIGIPGAVAASPIVLPASVTSDFADASLLVRYCTCRDMYQAKTRDVKAKGATSLGPIIDIGK